MTLHFSRFGLSDVYPIFQIFFVGGYRFGKSMIRPFPDMDEHAYLMRLPDGHLERRLEQFDLEMQYL